MSEYDQSFVYVPLDQLQAHPRHAGPLHRVADQAQELRGATRSFVTAELRKLFPLRRTCASRRWEEHQGPLLAAIDVERGILNLLLFMIVGVAGFSILAIFTMIVSREVPRHRHHEVARGEQRGRDEIFVGYGLLLGAVGCALGTVLGLWITENINEIEAFLTQADRPGGVPARRVLLQGNPDERRPAERAGW